ncbi:MAG: thiamine biosynthesis lipoprotein [Paraglaciecola sp.]|jgi:thiamine biosynthesis lipoprotein
MIENLLSFDDVNNEISQLNKSGRRGIELHPVSADVLRLALHMTGVTQGDFNCTNGGALIDKGLLADHGGSFLDGSMLVVMYVFLVM